ncbi:hypothetical protein E2C01_032344 [Portunus trituberculatus]|uniref:Uncharacterized protein n=1 Tax=Portunus trituberculatus TaxID=210409 RepID=A0A5B7F020_PORTR|nr:hypothetical protein [Portunus trituberculatus]
MSSSITLEEEYSLLLVLMSSLIWKNSSSVMFHDDKPKFSRAGHEDINLCTLSKSLEGVAQVLYGLNKAITRHHSSFYFKNSETVCDGVHILEFDKLWTVDQLLHSRAYKNGHPQEIG